MNLPDFKELFSTEYMLKIRDKKVNDFVNIFCRDCKSKIYQLKKCQYEYKSIRKSTKLPSM